MTTRVFVINWAYSSIDPDKLRVMVGSSDAPALHRVQLADPIRSVEELKQMMVAKGINRPSDVVLASAACVSFDLSLEYQRSGTAFPRLIIDDPEASLLKPI